MPRARNIKPALFKNELLGTADPILTVLFTGLWCLADKAGRLEDRPLRIKAEIFPYRELPDFNRYLTELERLGFIRRYQVNGIPLIDIPAFSKHQNPHHTERASQLPEFPEGSALTVISPLEQRESTDTLLLIPDSLIPDSGSLKGSIEPDAGKPASTRGKPLVTLRGYIAQRKQSGSKAIPEGHAVFAYAEQAGIPDDFLALAWQEFKTRYTTPPDDQKKYRDWPAVFLKAVRGNWMKVWYLEAGAYKLTTTGQQAEMAGKAVANA